MVNPCDAKEEADAVLHLLQSIVSSLNLSLVLCCGTCLGLVRDGGYIKNDNDIDVAILANFQPCTKEQKKSLSEKLRQNGFRSSQNPPVMLSGQEHWWKHSILVCIRWIYGSGNQIHSIRFFKSFDKVTYDGQTYNIPHPVEEYLTANYPKRSYGVDWRTPRIRGTGWQLKWDRTLGKPIK